MSNLKFINKLSNLKFINKLSNLKNYKKIEIENLKNVSINPEDYASVKDTINNVRKSYFSTFLATLLFVFLILFLIISDIKSGEKIFTSDYMIVILTFLAFLSLATYFFIKYLSINISAIKKCQYGILNSKYTRKEIINDRLKEKYYFVAAFPESNTYLLDVVCDKDIYNRLNEGSSILVISFDNQYAYAVEIN